MEKETTNLLSEGFTHSIFGDIFLEDLKQYREKQLAAVGLKAVFPLWKKDTFVLMKEFLMSGFKAICVCVNAKMLEKSFCGRIIDEKFLADLPEGVDPCGENGEFHTFVYDGPNFEFPIVFKKGEIVQKSYVSSKENHPSDSGKYWDTHFFYCDLIPK